MNGSPTSSIDLPPAEAPGSAQPGGFGFFVRAEIAFGKLRRALLRRFCPNHVERWKKRFRGGPVPDSVVDSRDLKFIRNVAPVWVDRADDDFVRRESLGFARYGFAELIGFSLVLGVIFAGSSLLSAWFSAWFLVPSTVAVFLWLEVLWFFRDPERQIPTDPDAILSPADGSVTHVETIEEPGMGPSVVRISIFLSVFNVHVNRTPRASRFVGAQYFRGRFLDARHPDCARQNEQLWADFVDPSGMPYRLKQISGAIARRIVCWARPGEEFAAGQRYGMIKFGSRTDFLAPADRISAILVKPGDKVRGGLTVLAKRRDQTA